MRLIWMPLLLVFGITRETHAATTEFETCDVVVVGNSLAGVFAALESAHLGVKTCFISESAWLGGQISSQAVSAIDAPHHLADIENRFRDSFVSKIEPQKDGTEIWTVEDNGFVPAGSRRVTRRGLFQDESVACLQPVLDQIPDRAKCWVSHDCFRPSEGDRVLRQLLAPEIAKGTLQLIERAVPLKVTLVDNQIRSLDVLQRIPQNSKIESDFLSTQILDWYDSSPSQNFSKTLRRFRGSIFVDATEGGELLVLAGAQHVLGAQDLKGHPLNSENVMGFVFPLNLSADVVSDDVCVQRQKEFESVLKKHCPEYADPQKFREVWAPFYYIHWPHYSYWEEGESRLSVHAYRKISDEPEVTMMNFGQTQPWAERVVSRAGGNDYSFGNLWIPAEKRRVQDPWLGGFRVEELKKAECHSLGFAKWLMTQSEVKEASSRKGRCLVPVTSASSSNHFFGTHTGLSQRPYIRETRRIVGYRGYQMNPESFAVDLAKQMKKFPDNQSLFKKFRASELYASSNKSIGIVSYALDTRKYPNGSTPSAFGFSYLKLSEIPLDALISANISNLFAAGKTIAQHQLVSSAARTQPFECQVGRGAGVSAATSVLWARNAHQLMEDSNAIDRIQTVLKERGVPVHWFDSSMTSRIPANVVPSKVQMKSKKKLKSKSKG
jgi:hypothetical protein